MLNKLPSGFVICAFSPDYAVNSLGVIVRATTGRSTYVGRPIATNVNHKGYVLAPVRWEDNGKKKVGKAVHKIVAETFIGPCPDGMQVNHKDGDKRNNSVENLEYVTPSENMQHAVKQGSYPNKQVPRIKRKPYNITSRLSDSDVQALRNSGKSQRALAKEYGVSATTVWAIRNNKRKVYDTCP